MIPAPHTQTFMGATFKSAVLASIAAVNSDDTVLPGIELLLEIRDNEGDPQTAVRVGNESVANISSSLIGVVGGFWSVMAIPFSEHVATPWQLPFVGFGASSSFLTSRTDHPFFVRLVPTNKQFAASVATFMQIMGWRRIGLLTTNDAYAGDLGASLLRDMGGSTNSGSFHATFDHTTPDGGRAAAALLAADLVHVRKLRVFFVETTSNKDLVTAITAIKTACAGSTPV